MTILEAHYDPALAADIRALAKQRNAVILAHNHPSGVPEPSQADELITHRLRDALLPGGKLYGEGKAWSSKAKPGGRAPVAGLVPAAL